MVTIGLVLVPIPGTRCCGSGFRFYHDQNRRFHSTLIGIQIRVSYQHQEQNCVKKRFCRYLVFRLQGDPEIHKMKNSKEKKNLFGTISAFHGSTSKSTETTTKSRGYYFSTTPANFAPLQPPDRHDPLSAILINESE